MGETITKRQSAVRLTLELPTVVLSAGLLVLVASVVGWWPWGTLLIAVWLASGPAVLVRKVEEAVMSAREDLRRPTPQELERLTPPWLAVTKAAGVDPGHYSLWAQKSPRVNAMAAAGHTVAVTEAAVQQLPRPPLEAVLAHELGHHLGGHAWASLLWYWYSLPAMYVFQFATYLSLALTSALGSGNMFMAVAMAVVVAGFVGYLTALVPVIGILVLVLVVVPFGLLWVSRAQEYQADAIAAQLGYGRVLARFLLDTAPMSEGAGPAPWPKRISRTHPSHLERARRLEAISER